MSAHISGTAHLDDGGGDEDGRLAARKGGQRGGLLVAAQASVQETHPGAAQQTLLLRTRTLPSRRSCLFWLEPDSIAFQSRPGPTSKDTGLLHGGPDRHTLMCWCQQAISVMLQGGAPADARTRPPQL